MAAARHATRLAQLLQDECDRRNANPPEVLYHYTDHDGLLGILATGGLYLSDVRFLNDSTELEFGRGIFREAIQHQREECGDPRISRALELASEHLGLGLDSVQPRYRFYSGSMCAAGDALGQWRAYGDSKSRCAVGFSTGALLDLTMRGGVSVQSVVYESAGQRELASRAVAACVEAIGGVATESYCLGELVDIAFGRIVPLLKNPAFSEEQEWRLFLSKRSVDGVSFRRTTRGLVPYVVCHLTPQVPGGLVQAAAIVPIVEVRQGPSETPDLHEKLLREILLSQGYDPAQVKVTRSQVPIR